ncbi:MAG TPA: multicopper oxidase domain-containing protein [Tepidisphaeraceae bacterium]|jgi:FtsP/CotA-like multicopper oxidase with cupredoxin domain
MSHDLFNEKLTRRRAMLAGAATLASGGLLTARADAAPGEGPAAGNGATSPPRSDVPTAQGYTPVVTPNGVTLDYQMVDGWKVMHLVAEEFEHEFAPGLRAICWGYNGRTPGPTIEAVEGDRLRIYVTNRIPAPTTVHWHGILLPNGMDGVTGLNQKPIPPGQTFKYEFTLRQHGTYAYHSHFDEMTQQAMGMMGMFVVHPRQPIGPKVDRDFAIMLSQWRIDPGTRRPNTMEMSDFNVLTMNSKAYPGTEPLVAKLGERVRIRFANFGAMDHHPIHLHGYTFRITETDGGRVEDSAQQPGNTVLVTVGATRAVEFVADAPGDWAMHCHMTHHAMNQMGHGTPNLIGVDKTGFDQRVRPMLPGYMTMGETGMGGMGDMGMTVPSNSIPMVGAHGPFDYIDMGGMFTILKVRDGLTTYADPGWYAHPPGTVADLATADELRRDGVDVNRTPTPALPPTAPAGGQPAPEPTPTPAPGVRYTCPMDPEIISDKPGRCPKCGMKLVAKQA